LVLYYYYYYDYYYYNFKQLHIYRYKFRKSRLRSRVTYLLRYEVYTPEYITTMQIKLLKISDENRNIQNYVLKHALLFIRYSTLFLLYAELDCKGYFHSTTLMLSLRIGLDGVRQKSDLDARMLKDAAPGLAVFGRRLIVVAAAALPAIVAAASAVAQPELSGRRQPASTSSPSPVADFRFTAAAPMSKREDSGGTTNVVAGSCCVRVGDGGSGQRSSAGGDDVGEIGVTTSGRVSNVTLTPALDVAGRSSSTVRPARCGSRQPGCSDDVDADGSALSDRRRSGAESSTSSSTSVNFDDDGGNTSTTCDCNCWAKLLGLAAALCSTTSPHKAAVESTAISITAEHSLTKSVIYENTTLAHAYTILWQEAQLSQRNRATHYMYVDSTAAIPFEWACNRWVTLKVTQGPRKCRYSIGHISRPISGL